MKSKKKLLIINPVHQLGYGAGYYYYCKYLKNEFDIDFLGFDKGLTKVDVPDIRAIYLNFGKNRIIRLLSFILYAIRLSRRNEYHAIFCVYFNLVFILGLLSRSKLKVIDIRTGSFTGNKFKKWLYASVMSTL